MKRRYITILLLLITTQIFAQETGSSYGFRLGLTAHPTFGWLKPETGKSNGMALGFSYGLLGDFNFAENYAFSTGVTVTTINGKSTEVNVLPYHENSTSANPVAYDLKYKLQYLEIPLTIKLKTDKIGEYRWYGQFGLSNDFNIGAKQSAESSGTVITDKQNISKYTNLYRAGMIIGAGGEYDIADHTSISFGLTYNNGFTDISDDKSRNVKNHYVGINFAVFF